MFDDVGDVFAAVGLVLVSVLDGSGDFFQAVDLDQGEDFLDVMASVEAALLELLIIVWSLWTQTQETGEQ